MGNIEHSEAMEAAIRRVLIDMAVQPGTDVIARRIRRALMEDYVPVEQLRGAVGALKLIACARAHDGQHAIDVALARNALEAMGVDPSLWRGQ